MYKTEFCVEVDNTPGQFARVCAALKNNGIKVFGIVTERMGNQGFIRMIPEDEGITRTALDDAGLLFSETKVLVRSFTNDSTELYNLAQKLSSSNINIDSMYLVTSNKNKVNMVFSTENIQKTAQLLG